MEREQVAVETARHVYTFQLLTAKQGVGLFHEYAAMLVENADDVKKVLVAFLTGETDESDVDNMSIAQMIDVFFAENSPYFRVAKLITEQITVERLFILSAMLLSGAKVDDVECDNDGMCPVFARNPLELYRAIAHAILANYKDAIPFSAGDDTEESPSQSETTQATI